MMQKGIPDRILYNGTFLSMNEKDRVYSAIAIQNGRIVGVSEDDSLVAKRGFGTELVDMEGKTVVPGFIDCNVHAIQTGLDKYCVSVNAASREEFLQQLLEVVEYYEEGELIWCVGYEAGDAEHHLNRFDLDRISSRHPIVVSRMEFHATVVNTNAYNLLSIPSSIRGVEKDKKGMPTGFLKGEASGFARRKINQTFVGAGLRKKALEDAVRQALACGITTMNPMEGGFFFSDDDMEAVQSFSEESPVGLLLFPQTMDVEAARAYGGKRVGGNIYLDGTLGSKTAALREPYEGDVDNNGLLYYAQEDLNQFVLEAHEKGFQVAISCIGERAIEQTLNAFELAIKISGKNRCRHRIEHFVLPTEEQIARAVKLGLIFSMQPNYDAMWGGPDGGYRKNIGDRYQRTNPIGTVIRAGGLVAGGSEAAVTPLSPIEGIHNAVNHHRPEHRVTVKEALRMYTVNGAYANFMEHRLGKIDPGFDADLAVLSENPLDVSPKRLREIRVLKTIKRGSTVFG